MHNYYPILWVGAIIGVISTLLILIAHRISTVEQMDKIVFVEDGEVHAVGKHEDLYRTCTAYRKMVDLQKLEEEAGEE